MSLTISPDMYPDLVDAASQPNFKDWLSMVRSTGGCADPIHLWGHSRSIHAATGEVLNERPPGKLLVACGNRRATRCPSCSETYRADTYQLIRAGLIGGKEVPNTVASLPRVFVTFTAPSFGPVHQRLIESDGRVKRCHPFGKLRCGQRHAEADSDIGQPLDVDSYDYVGAVLWNALATRLWARTVQLVNRHAARLLGVAQRDWANIGRVSVAKVAEYQARGVVHFHAIFRLDGPEQGEEAPTGATLDVLTEAIRCAAASARITPVAFPVLDGSAPLVWGEQLDLKPINANQGPDRLTDSQVAGYVAKYATKSADPAGTVDRPLACRACRGSGEAQVDKDQPTPCTACSGSGAPNSIESLPIPMHPKRMIETCWMLGGLPELASLRLRPWAHMLGFRGHFATKSRRYSTTLGCLRSARRLWRQEQSLTVRNLDPATPVLQVRPDELDELELQDDVVLVVGSWRYAGHGHNPGEAIFAASIREDLALARVLARQGIQRGRGMIATTDEDRDNTAAKEVPISERLALSVEEAGALLGISRDLAYDLVARRELPSVRLGRRLVVPRRSLEEALDRLAEAG